MIKVHAHRGASGYMPENTLPSFQMAHDVGSDGIECDIHRTADDRFIVCHDTTLDRTSNGTGHICDMTVADIQQYDFGSKVYYNKQPGATAPTLEEMLDVVKDMDPINIEVKAFAGDEEKALNDFYNILVKYDCVERVLVSSFNVTLLGRLKALHPDLKTGYLYSANTHKRMIERDPSDPEFYLTFPPEDALKTAKEQNCDAIHPSLAIMDAEKVAAAHEAGLQVNVWTVNTLKDVQRAIDIGVDGIITNYPDWVKFYLNK